MESPSSINSLARCPTHTLSQELLKTVLFASNLQMSNLSLTEWMDLVARPWDPDSMTVADQMDLLVPGLVDHNHHQQELPNRRSESKRVTKDLKKVKVENSESCAVCLEEFSVGSEACSVGCSHIYHELCIGQWLEKNNSCPLCRHKIGRASSIGIGN